MPDDAKQPETAQAATAAGTNSKLNRIVKVGDTVHLVRYGGNPAARFAKTHVEAEVKKVHQKGKCVDLVVPHDDPAQSLTITSSPRDDAGVAADTWHFPEEEKISCNPNR